MPISRAEREEISPEEFLATCSKYGLDVRRRGSRWWVYSDATTRPRQGIPTSPTDLVEFVVNNPYTQFRGEPTLKFIRNKYHPQFVALAYTEAGIAKLKSDRYWNWRQRGSFEPGRRPGRRRSRSAMW